MWVAFSAGAFGPGWVGLRAAGGWAAVIQLEGPGWRLAWRQADGSSVGQPFEVLIGGQGWAVELTAAEAQALATAALDLTSEHQALVDQLLAEEAISLELERGPWWLALEGDRRQWSLKGVLSPEAGQRALEVSWSVEASWALCQALQRLGGQP